MNNGGKNRKTELSDFVRLPYEIKEDKEFYDALVECLNQYKNWAERFLETNEGLISLLKESDKKAIVRAISTDIGIIINCVELYYTGNIAGASKRIGKLLGRIIEADKIGFIKSDLDKCYGCRLVACYPELYDGIEETFYDNLKNNELTFFRARKESGLDYKDMYHIPLEKRHIVGTERFSVPGIPCLYLGTSIYDVWLELGSPAYSDFNVSSVKFTESGKKRQILNLAITPYFFMGLTSINEEVSKAVEILKAIMRLYPLVIATSIRNKQPNQKFRSDYIISHLLMMNIKKLGIDGGCLLWGYQNQKGSK